RPALPGGPTPPCEEDDREQRQGRGGGAGDVDAQAARANGVDECEHDRGDEERRETEPRDVGGAAWLVPGLSLRAVTLVERPVRELDAHDQAGRERGRS